MEETCFSLFLTLSTTLDIICKTNIRHWKVGWKEKWPRVLSNNMVMSSLDFLLFTYFLLQTVHTWWWNLVTQKQTKQKPQQNPAPSSQRTRKKAACVQYSVVFVCNRMVYSLPGSSVHEIVPIRILKWVAISSPRESSQPSDSTQVPCIAGRFLTSEPLKMESS